MYKTTASAKSAYKAEIEVALVDGGKQTRFKQENVEYIMIEHRYEAYIIPIIYISIAVTADTRAEIINKKETAKMYLCIKKYNAYSGTSLKKKYIEGQFTYILPNINPEYSKDLSENNDNVDSDYTSITIGLLSMDIMNDVRKAFGGTFKGIDQLTMLSQALAGSKTIMKYPSRNKSYGSIMVPAITSRKDYIKWIFDKDPFYSTEYLYFHDFETSYLLDRTGVAVDGNDGQFTDVLYDIEDMTSWDAYNEGMQIVDGTYFFYIHPSYTNIGADASTEKIVNEVVAVEDDKNTNISLDINTSAGSTTKQRYVRMDSEEATVFKNTIESNQNVLELAKDNIDSRFITPNKCFMVCNYETYKAYDGRYILISKQEVIQGKAKDFACVVTARLRRIGDIQDIGSVLKKKRTVANSKTTQTSAKA